MQLRTLSVLVSTALAAGCASHSHEIQPDYVSPLEYQEYNCRQIQGEMRRVSRRAAELAGGIDEEADSDEAEMAVGMILFWPALFWLEGGDDERSAQYARLRGEYNALEQAGIKRDCGIQVKEVQPDRPAEEDEDPLDAMSADDQA